MRGSRYYGEVEIQNKRKAPEAAYNIGPNDQISDYTAKYFADACSSSHHSSGVGDTTSRFGHLY